MPDVTDIVWWEVETPVPDQFQRFHEAMWGWTFTPAFEGTELGRDYWLIRAGDRGIGGLQRGPAGSTPQAGVRLYVEVDDLEGALRRTEELGGRVERARTYLGDNDRWFANIVDPAGVTFGLWTSHPPS